MITSNKNFEDSARALGLSVLSETQGRDALVRAHDGTTGYLGLVRTGPKSVGTFCVGLLREQRRGAQSLKGLTGEAISAYPWLCIESDTLAPEALVARVRELFELGKLPAPTLAVHSGKKSAHIFWSLEECLTDASVWKSYQKALAALVGDCDLSSASAAKKMRFPEARRDGTGPVQAIIPMGIESTIPAPLSAFPIPAAVTPTKRGRGRPRTSIALAMSPATSKRVRAIDSYFATALALSKKTIREAGSGTRYSTVNREVFVRGREVYGTPELAYLAGTFEAEMSAIVPSDLSGYTKTEHSLTVANACRDARSRPLILEESGSTKRARDKGRKATKGLLSRTTARQIPAARYITHPDFGPNRLVLMRSPLGSGKTEAVKGYIAANWRAFVVYVTPTKELARAVAARLGLPCYDDERSGGSRVIDRSCVVCVGSLARVRIDGPFDLIVDEMTEVAGQLCSINVSQAHDFKRLVREARRVIGLDANAVDSTREWFETQADGSTVDFIENPSAPYATEVIELQSSTAAGELLLIELGRTRSRADRGAIFAGTTKNGARRFAASFAAEVPGAAVIAIHAAETSAFDGRVLRAQGFSAFGCPEVEEMLAKSEDALRNASPFELIEIQLPPLPGSTMNRRVTVPAGKDLRGEVLEWALFLAREGRLDLLAASPCAFTGLDLPSWVQTDEGPRRVWGVAAHFAEHDARNGRGIADARTSAQALVRVRSVKALPPPLRILSVPSLRLPFAKGGVDCASRDPHEWSKAAQVATRDSVIELLAAQGFSFRLGETPPGVMQWIETRREHYEAYLGARAGRICWDARDELSQINADAVSKVVLGVADDCAQNSDNAKAIARLRPRDFVSEVQARSDVIDAMRGVVPVPAAARAERDLFRVLGVDAEKLAHTGKGNIWLDNVESGPLAQVACRRGQLYAVKDGKLGQAFSCAFPPGSEGMAVPSMRGTWIMQARLSRLGFDVKEEKGTEIEGARVYNITSKWWGEIANENARSSYESVAELNARAESARLWFEDLTSNFTPELLTAA